MSAIKPSPPGQAAEQRLDDKADSEARDDQERERDDARQTPRGLAPGFLIQTMVEPVDGRPDRRDRMRQPAPERRGVADQRIEGERAEQNPQGVGVQKHQRPTRAISAASRSSASTSIGPPQTVSRSGMTMRRAGG